MSPQFGHRLLYVDEFKFFLFKEGSVMARKKDAAKKGNSETDDKASKKKTFSCRCGPRNESL